VDNFTNQKKKQRLWSADASSEVTPSYRTLSSPHIYKIRALSAFTFLCLHTDTSRKTCLVSQPFVYDQFGHAALSPITVSLSLQICDCIYSYTVVVTRMHPRIVCLYMFDSFINWCMCSCFVIVATYQTNLNRVRLALLHENRPLLKFA